MLPRSRAQERYLTDPAFHAVVSMLRNVLDQNQLDIESLMVAAVEAANQHVRFSPLPITIVINRGE